MHAIPAVMSFELKLLPLGLPARRLMGLITSIAFFRVVAVSLIVCPKSFNSLTVLAASFVFMDVAEKKIKRTDYLT